jgi:hypothetical protein
MIPLSRKHINLNSMNKLRSILLPVLIFFVTVPCFGESVLIKRKKNKWLFTVERTKTTIVNQDIQIKADSFVY